MSFFYALWVVISTLFMWAIYAGLIYIFFSLVFKTITWIFGDH